MKRRVKPFNELSRWQQNRRLRQDINEIIVSENTHDSEEERYMDLVVSTTEHNIENYEIRKDSTIQSKEISDILQDSDYSDKNYSSNDSDYFDEDFEGMTPENLNIKTFETCNKTFLSELKLWSVRNNISNIALSELLKLYKQYHPNKKIPSDARTFLHTPKKCIIQTCGVGEIFYYGLQKALFQNLRGDIDFIDGFIMIDVNIDGLPISKSTGSQLWPIQVKIINAKNCYQPFIVGIYHGMSKPSSVEEYLDEFINEYCVLRDEGFDWYGKHYFVRIRAMICDAPARSFLKCIKYPTGYNRCERCVINGEYDDKVIFLECDCKRRTDHSFQNKLDPNHHSGVSPLERLGIGMVSAFPLDYMHLVLLGVMKKLLLLWTKGVKECRISRDNYKILNQRLYLNQNIPSEISRKPRKNLNELMRWKATEFRTFLLYFAPFILHNIIPEDYIRHFSAFHCAIRILCDPLNCNRNRKYAEKLLIWFVQNFKHLYGNKNIIYCVHNLIHLADDIGTFGTSLDDFSCFPFENEMKNIKRYIRKHDKPLSQIYKRISEKSEIFNVKDFKQKTFSYPLLINKSVNKLDIPFENNNSYGGIVFEKFKLRTTMPNNICYLKDGSIFRIKYIIELNLEIFCIGYKVTVVSDVLFYPLESSKLDIYMIKGESTVLERIKIDEIKGKGFQVISETSSVVLPLIHSF